MTVLHVVSISGGKDSAATAILALETMPRESLRFIFCDTGNEHASTYEYIDYMGWHLGIQIETIKADFSADMERKRNYILEKWPLKGVPIADCERAAAAMVPTGIPMLDLCMMKGRFPSTMRAFCTQELKTKPAVEWQLGLIDEGHCDAVWSWQGVRIEESPSRRKRLSCPVHPSFHKSFEDQGAGIYTYRPILRWTAADVFEAADLYGLKPNPLYLQGMTRVGCLPCINAGKDEILEISKRFPEHIDRIEAWEAAVAQASKRMEASFFPDPIRDAHLDKRGIRKVVEWSKTQRGGQLMDWIRINEEPKACESAYGLCE
jgi:3'-phosphoadenosine 5'-phosphosulfate sulfotransferase (PAPS reductase)/FAD synthetase